MGLEYGGWGIREGYKELSCTSWRGGVPIWNSSVRKNNLFHVCIYSTVYVNMDPWLFYTLHYNPSYFIAKIVPALVIGRNHFTFANVYFCKYCWRLKKFQSLIFRSNKKMKNVFCRKCNFRKSAWAIDKTRVTLLTLWIHI